ncbi:hypothetical protein BUB20358_00651 [Burkholderia ubonensis]|nr:hypothetical protein BUB20358_00651 [Burkholderia ubonensis]
MPLTKPATYWRSASESAGGAVSAMPSAAAKVSMSAMSSSSNAGAPCASAGSGRAGASAVPRCGVSSSACAALAAATRLSATAQYFSSGCCETGSIASLVTALMHRSSPYTSFQCIGAKQLPGCTRSVTTAGSTARPRRERISTLSCAAIPRVRASSG